MNIVKKEYSFIENQEYFNETAEIETAFGSIKRNVFKNIIEIVELLNIIKEKNIEFKLPLIVSIKTKDNRFFKSYLSNNKENFTEEQLIFEFQKKSNIRSAVDSTNSILNR